MAHTSIQGPAGPLHLADGGEGGVPVIFLHSFGGSLAHWAPAMEHLRGTRRAVALDLRGHGKSARPSDGDYAIDSFAEDVGAVMDGLGLERAVLVGHSIGGSTAIAYAGAHPERVAGLVLVGAAGKVPKEQSAQIMSAMEADYEKVAGDYWEKLLADARPNVREQIRSEMNSVPKEDSLAIIGETFRYDPLPALGRYAGPKLAISTPHGDTPNDLQNLLPDLPHKVITGTSHWPHLDRPEEFNRLLDEFLAEIE